MEVVFRQSRGDAVVEHHAMLVEHQAIAALADAQLGPGVGVDHVDQFHRVASPDVYLSQGGGIDNPHLLPYGETLAVHRLVHAFAAPREVARALPVPDILVHCPVFQVPGLHRRGALLQKQLASVLADDGAETEPGVGGAKGGGAHLVDRAFPQVRHHGERIEVGGLPLVGTHTGCGIALEVFNRRETLALRERNIRDGGIVVKIMKMLLAAASDGMRTGKHPQRAYVTADEHGGTHRRRFHLPAFQSAGPGRGRTGFQSLAQPGLEGKCAVAAPRQQGTRLLGLIGIGNEYIP